MNSQKGFVIPLIIAIAAILAVGGVYYTYNKGGPMCWPYCKGMTDQDREAIKQSAIDAMATSTATTSLPFIKNIDYSYGSKGAIIQINGENLSGFEGDLNVTFERADGKKVLLTDTFGDYQKTGGSLIQVKVIEPCQPGEKVIGAYSGIESVCDYVELTPGIYKVYTEPWGKKSNIVNFTITAALPPSVTVISPNGGEVVTIGDKYNILWHSSDLNTYFSIYLVDESKVCPVDVVGCQSVFSLTSDFIKNTGSYLWDTNVKMGGGSTGPNSIPVTPGSKYKIKICSEYTCDLSDKYFTITSTVKPECTVDSDCPQLMTPGLFPLYRCVANKCVVDKTTCAPNWACGWSECTNGYQAMKVTDLSNCGMSSAGVQIACPALARECATTN